MMQDAPVDSGKVLQHKAAEPAPTPAAVKPIRKDVEEQGQVVFSRPMGLDAGQFGILSFLFLMFLTLSFLFLGQRLLVQKWPATGALYGAMGISVAAPGEGLKIGEMTAEKQFSNEGKTLVLEAKISNISEKVIAYPSLRVRALGAEGKVLEEWRFHPRDKDPVKPGESVPLRMEFANPPDDGVKADVQVIGAGT